MSPTQLLKRALVSLLLSFAQQFNVALQLNRDSPDEVVKKSFKKVNLKIHPDKPCGCKESQQKLNDAPAEVRRTLCGATHTCERTLPKQLWPAAVRRTLCGTTQTCEALSWIMPGDTTSKNPQRRD